MKNIDSQVMASSTSKASKYFIKQLKAVNGKDNTTGECYFQYGDYRFCMEGSFSSWDFANGGKHLHIIWSIKKKPGLRATMCTKDTRRFSEVVYTYKSSFKWSEADYSLDVEVAMESYVEQFVQFLFSYDDETGEFGYIRPADLVVNIDLSETTEADSADSETPETADYVCYVDGEEFIVPSNVVSTITSLAKEKVAGWDDKVAMGYVYYDDYKAVVYRDTLAIKKNNDSQFGKLISFSVTPCETVSAVSEAPEAKIALSDDIYERVAENIADAYAGGCCEMPSFWMDDDSDFMDNKIAEVLGTDVTYVWEHIDINYNRLWSMASDKWVEDRKKAIKVYIDDELANDPTFAEHLAIQNEEQEDSFNLVYEVGSYIYYALTDSTGEPVYDDSEVADVVSMYDWSMDADGVYWSEKEPVLEAYGEPVVVESNDGNIVAKMAC